MARRLAAGTDWERLRTLLPKLSMGGFVARKGRCSVRDTHRALVFWTSQGRQRPVSPSGNLGCKPPPATCPMSCPMSVPMSVPKTVRETVPKTVRETIHVSAPVRVVAEGRSFIPRRQRPRAAEQRRRTQARGSSRSSAAAAPSVNAQQPRSTARLRFTRSAQLAVVRTDAAGAVPGVQEVGEVVPTPVEILSNGSDTPTLRAPRAKPPPDSCSVPADALDEQPVVGNAVPLDHWRDSRPGLELDSARLCLAGFVAETQASRTCLCQRVRVVPDASRQKK